MLLKPAFWAICFATGIALGVWDNNLALRGFRHNQKAIAFFIRTKLFLWIFSCLIVLLPFFVFAPHLKRKLRVAFWWFAQQLGALLVRAFRSLKWADFVYKALMKARHAILMGAIWDRFHRFLGNLHLADFAGGPIEPFIHFLASTYFRCHLHEFIFAFLASFSFTRRTLRGIFMGLCDDVLKDNFRHFMSHCIGGDWQLWLIVVGVCRLGIHRLALRLDTDNVLSGFSGCSFFFLHGLKRKI